MRRLKGSVNVRVIVSVVIALAFVGMVTFFVINDNKKVARYETYTQGIVAPNDDNGGIGDHVKGNADAPVIIYEYADYQCPGCASINPRVNKAVEELDGKLAVVYRSFLLSYHQNGTAAASAAEAAGLQGYWKQYADMLFAKQSEWGNASSSERTALFDKYFLEVTDNEGDLDKFNQDIASKAVSKKISFDMDVGKKVNVGGTPAFYIDGQLINWSSSGHVTIDGKTVTWDSAKSGDEFVDLLKEIVNTKLEN